MCQQRTCPLRQERVEEILDKDLAVFVSISTKLDEEMRFLFADRTLTNHMLRPGMNWKDMDSIEMIFLGPKGQERGIYTLVLL